MLSSIASEPMFGSWFGLGSARAFNQKAWLGSCNISKMLYLKNFANSTSFLKTFEKERCLSTVLMEKFQVSLSTMALRPILSQKID